MRLLVPLSDCVLHACVFTLSEMHTPLRPLHPGCHLVLCWDPCCTWTVILSWSMFLFFPPWNAQMFPALETRGPAMNRICSTTFFWQCFLPPAQNMNESFCSALIALIEFWLISFYPVFAHCRVLQDLEMVQSPSGNPSQHYCSSPSNQSTSSDPGPCGTWAQKASYDG